MCYFFFLISTYVYLFWHLTLIINRDLRLIRHHYCFPSSYNAPGNSALWFQTSLSHQGLFPVVCSIFLSYFLFSFIFSAFVFRQPSIPEMFLFCSLYFISKINLFFCKAPAQLGYATPRSLTRAGYKPVEIYASKWVCILSLLESSSDVWFCRRRKQYIIQSKRTKRHVS